MIKVNSVSVDTPNTKLGWDFEACQRIILLGNIMKIIMIKNALMTLTVFQVLARGPDPVQGCEPETG